MGMLMHHTWQEQQKAKPVEKPIEKPAPKTEQNEENSERKTASRKTGGRRKVNK